MGDLRRGLNSLISDSGKIIHIFKTIQYVLHSTPHKEKVKIVPKLPVLLDDLVASLAVYYLTLKNM